MSSSSVEMKEVTSPTSMKRNKKKGKENKTKESKGKEPLTRESRLFNRGGDIGEFHWCERPEKLAELEENHPEDFCIIKDDETVTEALRRLDKTLLLGRKGNSIMPSQFTTTIPRGRLGLAVKRGSKPLFIEEGTYFLKGFYVKWARPDKIVSLTDPLIKNVTVTILTLTDREGAVLREGSNLRTLGRGRYIIREPLVILHVFNESDFVPVERQRTTVEGITEMRTLGKQIFAQKKDKVVGCRFIQVAPGCCAVVQVGSKLLVFPEGWYRLRSLDHSVTRWLDLREVSDTVMNVRVVTSNQAQMTLDVYVRTRLDDPIAFTEACEYSDMQDALDDKSLDVMQRLVGSRTYAEILADLEEGEESFDNWLSRQSTDILRPYAEQLGGELLEMSVVRRRFADSIQRTLDKQAEATLELETKRRNMETTITNLKKETEGKAERDRIAAEGLATAARIEARAERERIEQVAKARAAAVQEMAKAYTDISDEFARIALQNDLQVQKFKALGDKTLIVPADLSLGAVTTATNMQAANFATGLGIGNKYDKQKSKKSSVGVVK